MNRRQFSMTAASALGFLACRTGRADEQQSDPWKKGELIEPADLARLLNTSSDRPAILCVAFPVLYRQRHIVHAEFAGPTSKPEGIEALKTAASSIPHDREVVIYCGCCPMVRCPNIRPAYRTLKEAGFKNVRVLNLPENFHTDWVAKAYPTEERLGVPVRVGPMNRK